MPDLQPIKERLRWGPTIDDASAVNRSYREDIQALVPEVERLRIAVDMYRRITGDNEAEIKRLRAAIARHRDAAGGKASGKSDVELWAVLDA